MLCMKLGFYEFWRLSEWLYGLVKLILRSITSLNGLFWLVFMEWFPSHLFWVFASRIKIRWVKFPHFVIFFFFFSFLVFIEFIIFTQPKMKRKENIIRPSYITPPSHTSGSVKLPPHMCGVRFDSFHCKKNK